MSATWQGTVTEPLIIATDGSIRGTHKGTWGWVRQDGQYAVGSPMLPQLSSTIVELVAVVEALRSTPVGATVHLRSDSQSALQYLVGAATVTGVEPISRGTLSRNLTRDGAIDVLALARAARDLCKERDVTAHWVKGHADDAMNIHVDALIAQVQDGELPASSSSLDATSTAAPAPCDACGAPTHPAVHSSITAARHTRRVAALHDVVDSAPQARFVAREARRIDLVCAGVPDLSGVWAWLSTDGTYAVGAIRSRFDTADPAAVHRAGLTALTEAIAATPVGADLHISARSATVRSLAHNVTVTSVGEAEQPPPAVRRGLRHQLDELRALCSERTITIHELQQGMPGAAAISRLLADGAAAKLRKRSIYLQAYVASFKADQRRDAAAARCDCGVRVAAASAREQVAAGPRALPSLRQSHLPAAGSAATSAATSALPETFAALDRVAVAAAGGGVLR